jgi:RNA polymerase sigma-70 factor (ECF subfamily)
VWYIADGIDTTNDLLGSGERLFVNQKVGMENETDKCKLEVERFRTYLLVLARVELGRHPSPRLEASDLVQQTLLDAHRQLGQFRGQTPAEMAGWLRRMLACNLADARRALERGKRDVRREQSLEAALADSSARLESLVAAPQSSPSQQAAHHENILRLADALTTLPEAQREAIVMHYWQELPVAEVATRLGRTPAAVAGLLQRGLKTLRSLLQND